MKKMEVSAKKHGEINGVVLKISELPQTPSWSPSVPFYNLHGYWVDQRVINGVVSFHETFQPQPNDIFICTQPQCGTTWLKALSFAILTRSRYTNDDDSPLLSKSPHDLVPTVELLLNAGKARDTGNPLLYTHFPYSAALPKLALDSDSKIIYVCRDPKDAFVSHFFFLSERFDVSPFEDVYKMFCNGISHSGPYWDHVLEYWKASLEFPERLLFLKYEDLKSDVYFYVKKIADFMGFSFSLEEEENGAVEKIVRLCSVENLSSLEVNNCKHIVDGDFKIFSNASFFRNGEVGIWKNYLTPQMAERIDEITYQMFNPHGLTL